MPGNARHLLVILSTWHFPFGSMLMPTRTHLPTQCYFFFGGKFILAGPCHAITAGWHCWLALAAPPLPPTKLTLRTRRAIIAQRLAKGREIVGHKIGISSTIGGLWEEVLDIPVINTLLLACRSIEQKVAAPVLSYQ